MPQPGKRLVQRELAWLREQRRGAVVRCVVSAVRGACKPCHRALAGICPPVEPCPRVGRAAWANGPALGWGEGRRRRNYSPHQPAQGLGEAGDGPTGPVPMPRDRSASAEVPGHTQPLPPRAMPARAGLVQSACARTAPSPPVPSPWAGSWHSQRTPGPRQPPRRAQDTQLEPESGEKWK